MRAHIDKVTGELLVFARKSPDIFVDGDKFDGTTLPFG
jgi:hypothetical protein